MNIILVTLILLRSLELISNALARMLYYYKILVPPGFQVYITKAEVTRKKTLKIACVSDFNLMNENAML